MVVGMARNPAGGAGGPAAGNTGSGGGAGEGVEFIWPAPPATATYTVGSKGTGGAAGTHKGGDGGTAASRSLRISSELVGSESRTLHRDHHAKSVGAYEPPAFPHRVSEFRKNRSLLIVPFNRSIGETMFLDGHERIELQYPEA